MTLQLNELLLLDLLEMSKVLDEVKEISWCDVIELFGRSHKFLVNISNRNMKVDNALAQ
jgi:hypothetical protein